MRSIARSVLILVACWAGLTRAWSQANAHEEHQVIGWVPREQLERPVPLRQGIGNLHSKVTTTSSQAQAFYDQGLDYVQSYVWIEAARSFHQALRLDAKLAMAYLGLSDVDLGLQDTVAAIADLDKAKSLSSDVPDSERVQIEIRTRQFEYLQNSQNIEKYFAYRKAVADALAANPADPWLWILRGFADERSPYGHGQGGGVDTIAFYEAALMLSPDNFAAHHYLIHSFENIGRTEEALLHAQAYVRLAPAIPHAHHMLGHDLRRIGRTEEAIEEFRRADELEDDYYRAEHVPAEYDWHHVHNLDLLAMCYEALGKMKSAEQLLRESSLLPAHTDSAELNRQEWPEFLLRRGRLQEALTAAQELFKSGSAMVRFAGHALAGRALLGLNRLDEARQELGLAEQEETRLPPAAKLLPYADALRAELLLREKSQMGEMMMKDVTQRLRALPGPDNWSQALFELQSIADVARETGAWELAEFVAQQIVRHDSSYAGGYYELGLVAEHRGDLAGVRKQFSIVEKLWSKADPDLPELGQVRQKLSTLR